MKEVCARTDISLHYPEESGSIILAFAINPLLPYIPTTFRVSVPRFYPHNSPIVHCLDEGYSTRGNFACPYILPSGEIMHDGLGESWSAIGSLATVIDILQNIRVLVQQNPQCVLRQLGSSSTADSVSASSSSSSSSNSNSISNNINSEHHHIQEMMGMQVSDSVTQVEYFASANGAHYPMAMDQGDGDGQTTHMHVGYDPVQGANGISRGNQGTPQQP